MMTTVLAPRLRNFSGVLDRLGSHDRSLRQHRGGPTAGVTRTETDLAGAAVRSRGSLRRRGACAADGVWTPGDALQIEAVVAACVLVAESDGWVLPEERARLVARLEEMSIVAPLGVAEVIDAFERLCFRFERDPVDGAATAQTAVRRLRGEPALSRCLVQTACEVALADGGLDAGERDTILRLCAWLDLDPGRFDLLPVADRPQP